MVVDNACLCSLLLIVMLLFFFKPIDDELLICCWSNRSRLSRLIRWWSCTSLSPSSIWWSFRLWPTDAEEETEGAINRSCCSFRDGATWRLSLVGMEKTDDDGIWMFPLVNSIYLFSIMTLKRECLLLQLMAIINTLLELVMITVAALRKLYGFKYLSKQITFFGCLLWLCIVLCCFLKLAVEIVFRF